MLQQKSIKKNFVSNLIKISVNILFPLVTFPYVSRILLVDGIGRVNFINSVINYFLIFANLGIPLYGIKAVARVRDDKARLTATVQELLLINSMTTILTLAALAIATLCSGMLKEYTGLLLVMSPIIIFSGFGVEWYFQGLEEYSYLTKRTLLFKLVSLVLLFTLVRRRQDVLIYAAVLTLSLIGNNSMNFAFLLKQVPIFSRGKLDIRKHIKPILITSALYIVTSIYLNLNVVMLGFISGDVSVGIYTAAYKIINLVVTIVTSLGGVLLPRTSYLIELKQFEEFLRISRLSARFIIMLALPAMVGLVILAPSVIHVFAGSSFQDASLSMRLMLPNILFLGFSSLLGVQMLYPLGKEKQVLYSFIGGAAINIAANIFLIPALSHNGAVLSSLAAEFTVLVVQTIYVKSILRAPLLEKAIYKYFIASAAMAAAIYLPTRFVQNDLAKILVDIAVGACAYFAVLWLSRESLCRKIFGRALAELVAKRGS